MDQDTHNFLRLESVLEEVHVRCLLVPLHQRQHALWLHRLSCTAAHHRQTVNNPAMLRDKTIQRITLSRSQQLLKVVYCDV